VQPICQNFAGTFPPLLRLPEEDPTTYSGEKNNSTTSIHFLLDKIKLFSVFVFFQHTIFLCSLVFSLTKKCVSLFLNPAYKFIFNSFIKKAQKKAKKIIAPLQHLLAKSFLRVLLKKPKKRRKK